MLVTVLKGIEFHNCRKNYLSVGQGLLLYDPQNEYFSHHLFLVIRVLW